jgi:hypothetical protein
MKEDISESLTFDDVSMLMNEKGSFTEKIISLAENSEYIKFLVDDLIDADSSYFKRLIRLVMSDYGVNCSEWEKECKNNIAIQFGESKEKEWRVAENYNKVIQLVLETFHK